MNSKEILGYVELQPSVVREVFSSISTSGSAATARVAKETALSITKKINDSVQICPAIYIQENSVDDFMAFAIDWLFRQEQTMRYQIVVKPLKPLWVRISCYIYDLNFNIINGWLRTNPDLYQQVGYAIILAGLYLLLKDEDLHG